MENVGGAKLSPWATWIVICYSLKCFAVLPTLTIDDQHKEKDSKAIFKKYTLKLFEYQKAFNTKLYIRVVLCVQGQCYQMKVQIYGHLLPNKFSKIKFIKFWLKNHQKSGDNLTKSIRNSFSKISILAFLPSFQLESSCNLDACTKQTQNFTYGALPKREQF